MRSIPLLRCTPLALAALVGCVDPLDPLDAPEDDPASLYDDEPELGVAASASFYPFAFARITPAGGVISHFSSASAKIPSVTHSSVGVYTIQFPGLGTSSLDWGVGGNAQLVNEGSDNRRCRIMGWSTGTSVVTVHVRCARPDGVLADSAFGVSFVRNTMGAPVTPPTGEDATTAYLWSTAGGSATGHYSYNSAGGANLVRRTAVGRYDVVFPGFFRSSPYELLIPSIIVTPYGGADPGAVCTITSSSHSWLVWPGSPLGFAIQLECLDRTGAFVDTAFSVAVGTSGPPFGQQSAYINLVGGGFWNSPGWFGRQGKCSSVAISHAVVSPHASVTVQGDLGTYFASDPPAKRISFASAKGRGTHYCKVESLTSTGAAPSSSSTTTIHCYDYRGVTAEPGFQFVQLLDQIGLSFTGCD